MPKEMMEKMKRAGVTNPHAMLNAAGYQEGDDEATVKRKLAAFQKARKFKRKPKKMVGESH